MLRNSDSNPTSDQESDSSQNTEHSENRFDCILDDLLGNLSLGTNMTIKNRKERQKHDNSDRSKEPDVPGPSSSRGIPCRSHPYLHPDLLLDPVSKPNRLKGIQSHDYDFANSQSSSYSQSDKDLGSHDKITKRCKRLAGSKRRQAVPFTKSPEVKANSNEAGNNSEDEYLFSASSPTVKSEENFSRLLKEKKGWQLVEVGTDGACLFRSVAHQIFGDEEKHDIIRKQVCDYMLKNREHFSPYVTEDFDHYIARKQHPNCHGNHVEIQAIAELYNRPVEIYRDNIEPVNVFHAEYRNSVPIRLSYHGHVHYNSIIDPYNPTFGLGLGMPNYQPGLPEPQLVQKAMVESEDALLEDAMLRDKLFETDQLEIEHRIEDQVMRESYYEYLKSSQKTVTGDRGSTSSRLSPKLVSSQARSPQPFLTAHEEVLLPSSGSAALNISSTKRRQIAGATAVKTTLATSPKPLHDPQDTARASASNWREPSPTSIPGPSASTNTSIDLAILRNIPPEMLDMDEDSLMALVLDQSRHEYVQNMNAKNSHEGVRAKSNESNPDDSDGPSASKTGP